MNRQIETDFVKKYIKTEYQERLLYELRSPTKRIKALSRFSHSAETVLTSGFHSCDMAKWKDDLLHSPYIHDTCYLISFDKNDGRTLSFAEAIDAFETTNMAMILISPKCVLVKEEYESKPIILGLVVSGK